jgi:MscS family membrane protein
MLLFMKSFLLSFDWHFFEERIGGERVSDFLWCAGIIIATLLLKKPLAKGIAYLSSKIAQRFSHQQHGALFQSLILKPLESLLQTVLFYIAINQLGQLLSKFALHRYQGAQEKLAISFGDIVDHVFLLLIILFTTLFISRVIDFVFHVLIDKAFDEQNRDKMQLFPLMKEVAKILIWTISFFGILGSVFHVNIPALITGLGIGGVAIALAAKQSVENLFAAFTLLSDRPFQTGDNIKLGSLEGTVEGIGFRSTRLRSGDGSLHVIPNQKLVNDVVENLTLREKRRVRIPVNIRYRLSKDALPQLVDEIKNVLKSTSHLITPIEVNVEAFNENSFQLMIVYHLPFPLEDVKINDIKQDISMKVFSIVDKYTTPKPRTLATGTSAVVTDDDVAENGDDAPSEE